MVLTNTDSIFMSSVTQFDSGC